MVSRDRLFADLMWGVVGFVFFSLAGTGILLVRHGHHIAGILLFAYLLSIIVFDARKIVTLTCGIAAFLFPPLVLLTLFSFSPGPSVVDVFGTFAMIGLFVFLFGIPAGYLTRHWSSRTHAEVGLLLFGTGAILFAWPVYLEPLAEMYTVDVYLHLLVVVGLLVLFGGLISWAAGLLVAVVTPLVELIT